MRLRRRNRGLVSLLSAAIAVTSLSLTGCAKPVPTPSEMEPCPEISPVTWGELVEILGQKDEDGSYKWEVFPLWLSDVIRYCGIEVTDGP